uniref:NADH dehydrogenase subunit 5 n=1 Tax=Megacopta caliginosa TaxID=2968962 RepID=UPI002238E46A|nr:NADH dehydrogenase subunit 5 [Megacopta caliginosa]UYA97675.1 NADH dehydrogenase subunit 5 [Megacopta caliginosa]UYA97688.1 NADH dehydrogenase subunit 5 [Megacopta caliginosa]
MLNLCLYKLWSFFLFIIGSIFMFLGSFFIYDNYSIFFDWEIYSLNSVSIYMTLIFDWMSLIFMGCVLYISSMVIFYSSSYMSHDIFSFRFLLLVLLFIMSMMLLIISPNLVSILLGWDGLGLVSYCLVIYFQNVKSYSAGMLTVLVNRIGDVSILISISWLMNSGGYNYYFCFHYSDFSYWIGYLLLIAAFTKSAQMPFSSWLPAAMAAPTPVSALVHSSTLVTAGVYLLIRFYNLLLHMDLSYFLLISCLTMFMSGIGANFEFDLKSIIALSTLSQLGMMMSILFMGYPNLSYFHLLSHAFFKALLFLCAGLIIHVMSDSQDIRHMGFVINYLPFTCSCFCISNLSLCGFPFLSGFYSKDLILEYMISGYFNLFIYLVFFISVGLTACYSFRLIYYCVSFSSGLYPCQNYYESGDMMVSMIILTIMSIIFGSIFNWLILPNFSVFIFPLECKLMPIIFVLIGSLLGYEFSKLNLSNLNLNYMSLLVYNYLGSMWFMPNFSTYVSSPTLNLSNYYVSLIDGGWCEYLISLSPLSFFSYLSKITVVYHNNSLKLYLLSFLFWFMFLVVLFN